MAAENLVLTTYPGHSTKNVGDNLITASTVQLIRNRLPEYDPMVVFREQRLDDLNERWFNTIVAPGLSVRDGTYPKLFRLYSQLERLDNFFPVGCSFQHISPALESFTSYKYSEDTLKFLQFVTRRFGPLPCRDELIVGLMHRFNLPAVYSGDLAIYDERRIGTPMHAPQKIRSLVFSIQHRERYIGQSQQLLRLLKEALPDAQMYVAHHGVPDSTAIAVADVAKRLGFSELNLFGEVANLDVYDNIDFHIGYRLHGHISFLRRRKPSILLVEDARSYGFAKSAATSIGCFDALIPGTSQVDDDVPRTIVEHTLRHCEMGFQDYEQLFANVDQAYNDFVKPYFDELAQRCRLRSPAHMAWRRLRSALRTGRNPQN